MNEQKPTPDNGLTDMIRSKYNDNELKVELFQYRTPQASNLREWHRHCASDLREDMHLTQVICASSFSAQKK